MSRPKKQDRSYEARAESGRTVMAFGGTLNDRATSFARERGLKLVEVTRIEREIPL